MPDKFTRRWNPPARLRTWMDATTPGPWAVETTPLLKDWYIINTETGRCCKVGPVHQSRLRSKIDNFDRAMALANARNAALSAAESLSLAAEGISPEVHKSRFASCALPVGGVSFGRYTGRRSLQL